MCKDVSDTRQHLVLTSVVVLKSGQMDCDLHDARDHYQRIEAENRRREFVAVRGSVRSDPRGEVVFDTVAGFAEVWNVNFTATGYKTTPEATLSTCGAAAGRNAQVIAELEYRFDDPFSVPNAYGAAPDLTIVVNTRP